MTDRVNGDIVLPGENACQSESRAGSFLTAFGVNALPIGIHEPGMDNAERHAPFPKKTQVDKRRCIERMRECGEQFIAIRGIPG